MAQLTGAQRASYVQSMFTRIAGRYDVMNRLMTLGQDGGWRRRVIALAEIQPGDRVLDLGTGTGDLAFEARQRQASPTQVVAGDFTLEMMRVGQQRAGAEGLRWAGTDALNLPFADDSFDVLTSGYLMRNVADLERAWVEQYRVLRPGGRVVCLDTTPPPNNLLRPFILFHLNAVIPALGRLIAGSSDAYTYLPDSTRAFLAAEQLADSMVRAGFDAVRFERHMFGTMAIHVARKPR
jgi:demethylmenaquinone methyltransferase/2-methoxy-6-polyprenyl-1,4-benzoquinol methylase